MCSDLRRLGQKIPGERRLLLVVERRTASGLSQDKSYENLEVDFKEYKVCTIVKEIRRIEEKLEDNVC